MRITLNRIYRFLGLNQQTNNDIVISQVVVDSRKVTKGSMFVALHGERTDGHEYIACAIEKGAAVILAEENYRRKIESDIASALLKKATIVYSIAAIIFIFLGTMVKSDLVWGLQDMFNQLMVIPNVFALITLSSLVTASACKKEQ